MRWVGRAVVAVVLLGGVIYGIAWVTTDHFSLSRAVVWLESDTGDIHRFPSRPIPAGDASVDLPKGPALELDAVWPAGDAETFLADTGTAAFLVLQGGRIRYEQYFNGTRPDELRTSFSSVKSVVSTLIGLAVDEGHIRSVDDPITDYLPELAERDPRYTEIRIRDLLTMTSGLRYSEKSLPWSDDAQTYYGTDLRGTALSSPVVEPAGQTFLYNNFNLLLEGLILERATGMSVSEFTSTRLWQPMGAEADASWSLDSVDSGFEKMESGLNAVARDYARFGLLFANGGRAGDRQVVDEAWVRQATSAEAAGGAADHYAFHWWTGAFDGEPLPPGHFMAAGNYGQFVYVAPEQDVVIVRLGDDYGSDRWPQILAEVAESI